MPKNINNIISSGLNIFKKRPDRIAYVIFVVSSIFYLMQISKAELNGDCATYAGIIEDKNLNVLPVHFGFYLVGILFNKILPFSTIMNLDIMSCMFGAISVMTIYLITLKLTNNMISSLIASATLMFSGFFWFHSIYNEVYVTQVAFISLTYLAWIYKKDYLSGVCFLMAMLISPLSLLAIPGLIMNGIRLEQIIKRITKFVIFSLPLYMLFHVFYWNRFFEGRSLKGGALEYMLPRGLAQYAGSFSFSLFLLLVGVIIICTLRKRYRWALAAYISIFVGHIIVISKLGGEFYLPLFPMTAIMAGIGYDLFLKFYDLNSKIKNRIYLLLISVSMIFLLFLLVVFIFFSRFRYNAINYLKGTDSSHFLVLLIVFVIIMLAITIQYINYKGDKRKRHYLFFHISSAIAVILTLLFSASLIVFPQIQYSKDFRKTSLEIASIRSSDSVILASTYSYFRLYKFYTMQKNNIINIKLDIESKEQLNNIIDRHDEVWIIDKFGKRNLESIGINFEDYHIKEIKLENGKAFLINYKK